MVFTHGTPQPPPRPSSSIRVGKQPATLTEQPEETQSDQNSPTPDTTVLLALVQTMQQQIDTLLQRDVERGNSQSTNTTLLPDNSYTKDPRDRINHADVPKYDGTNKDAESWVLEFGRYCKLIRLTEDDHILTAFGITMTSKAVRWWEHAEKALPHTVTWIATKQAFLRKYGNVLKHEECTDKLRTLFQGSMTIADYFTELEDLNLYAQLDPETRYEIGRAHV